MATGTTGGLLNAEPLQSYLKHQLLRRYIIQFVQKLAHGTDDPLTLVDGYAGNGRYDDGTPASAELLLQAAVRSLPGRVRVVMVEPDPESFGRLHEVAEEYREPLSGQLEVLGTRIEQAWDRLVSDAAGRHVFMFLDPCGGTLSMDQLVSFLNRNGRRRYPRTELLINFSGFLVRRVSGQHAAGYELRASVLTDMCGGTWWKDLVDEDQVEHPNSYENSFTMISAEYARQLNQRTGYATVAMPVRARARNQPVFYMVFATANPVGLWAFNDAAARAQQDWLVQEDLVTSPNQPSLLDPDETVLGMSKDEARQVVHGNVLQMLSKTPRIGPVRDHTFGLLDGAFGLLNETEIRAELKAMRADGLIGLQTAARAGQDVITRPS